MLVENGPTPSYRTALVRELDLPKDVYLQIPVHAPGETNLPLENP